jgi:glycogen debranching enzyme
LLQAFDDHLKTAALGQISEIADGDSPYEPRGCVAQAWSIGELLRAAVEDVYEIPLSSRTEAAVARV